MSDLIKEMRSFQLYPDHYLRLGADEIERLTADAACNEAQLKNIVGYVEQLQAKVEQLEGALRRIATRDYNETAQAFAEQALGGDDE